ncbi:MAG: hypothetical protein HQM12_10440 [SAR324 cluster bacterium]|nr:hypothetical protein [SAR324 cluster bacterium]
MIPGFPVPFPEHYPFPVLPQDFPNPLIPYPLFPDWCLPTDNKFTSSRKGPDAKQPIHV